MAAYLLRAEFTGTGNLTPGVYTPEVGTLVVPEYGVRDTGNFNSNPQLDRYLRDGAGAVQIDFNTGGVYNELNTIVSLWSGSNLSTADYGVECEIRIPALTPWNGGTGTESMYLYSALGCRVYTDANGFAQYAGLWFDINDGDDGSGVRQWHLDVMPILDTEGTASFDDAGSWIPHYTDPPPVPSWVWLGTAACTVKIRMEVQGRVMRGFVNGTRIVDRWAGTEWTWTGTGLDAPGKAALFIYDQNDPQETLGLSSIKVEALRASPIPTSSSTSDFLLDTFTDPNGMFLDAHVGDSGVTWIKDDPQETFQWVIQGNALQEADYLGGTGTTARETHSTVEAPGVDYGVEWTLIYTGVAALVELSISMRGYTIHDAFPERFNAVRGHLTISFSGATSTANVGARENHPTGGGGANASNLSLSNSNGVHIVRLEVLANVASLYYDGVKIVSSPVTGFAAPGWAGFSMGAANMNGFGVVKIDKIRAYTIDPPGSFWTSRVKCTEVIGAAGTFMRVRRPPPPAPPPPRELEVYDLPVSPSSIPLQPRGPSDPNYPFDPVLHSTVVLDYFNDPAGTDITTHVGQAGTPWTIHPLFGQAPAPSQSLFRMTGISVRRTTYDEDYNYDGGNAMLLPAGRIAGNSKLSIYLRVNASLPYNATNAEVGVYHNTVLAYDPSNTDALFVFRTNAIFLASAGGTITIPLTLPGGDYHVLYESDGLNASVYLNGVLKGSVVRAVQIVDALSFYIFDGSSVGDVAIDTVHVYVPNLPGAFWTDRTRCTEVVS